MIYVYAIKYNGKLYGLQGTSTWNYDIIVRSTEENTDIVLKKETLHLLNDIEEPKKGISVKGVFPNIYSAITDCFGNMAKTLRYRLSMPDYDITVGDNDELFSWIQHTDCDKDKDLIIDLRSFNSISELCFSLEATSVTFKCKEWLEIPPNSLKDIHVSNKVIFDISDLQNIDYVQKLISLASTFTHIEFVGRSNLYHEALVNEVRKVLGTIKLFDNYVGSGLTEFDNPWLNKSKQTLTNTGKLNKFEAEFNEITKNIKYELFYAIREDINFYNALRDRIRTITSMSGFGDYSIHGLAFVVRAIHKRAKELEIEDKVYYYCNLSCFLGYHDTLYLLGKAILDNFVYSDRLL